MQKIIVTALVSVALTLVVVVPQVGPSDAADKIVTLPAVDKTGGMPLMAALAKRKTTRSFSAKELTTAELSALLWAAFGVNRPESGKRTAPTAMDEREITIYVATGKGVYVYDADKHALLPHLSEDIRAMTGKQSFTADAPVSLVFVASYDEMEGSQASKVHYSTIDTGYISQNVYLYCASEGLGTVALDYVDREPLAKKLGLGANQHIVLTQPVGFPAK